MHRAGENVWTLSQSKVDSVTHYRLQLNIAVVGIFPIARWSLTQTLQPLRS